MKLEVVIDVEQDFIAAMAFVRSKGGLRVTTTTTNTKLKKLSKCGPF